MNVLVNQIERKRKTDNYISLRFFASKGITDDVDFPRQEKRPILGRYWNRILNVREFRSAFSALGPEWGYRKFWGKEPQAGLRCHQLARSTTKARPYEKLIDRYKNRSHKIVSSKPLTPASTRVHIHLLKRHPNLRRPHESSKLLVQVSIRCLLRPCKFDARWEER